MYKDNPLNKPDRNCDSTATSKPSNADVKSEAKITDQTAPKKNQSFKAEHLPLGTGYQVKELPTEVLNLEITVTEEIIPDLVKHAQISELLDAPLPAPEDDFYDFDKDIYGDEADFQP